MDAILNNPFRILGLEPTLDETIISERVSEILMNLSNGNKVIYPLDEFYDKILVDPFNSQYYNNLSSNKGEPIPTRNIETVKIAQEKLRDPIKKKYYALFSFQIHKTNDFLNIDDHIKIIENELQIKENKKIKEVGNYWGTENMFLKLYLKEKGNDWDYAADFCITDANFNKVKNLALYHFYKFFKFKNLTATTSETDLSNDAINKLTNIEKGLRLFGFYFQIKFLLSSGIFRDKDELTSDYNLLVQIFINDFIEKARNYLLNDFGEYYQCLIRRLENYSTEFIENLFLFSKEQLLYLPENEVNDKYYLDVKLLKQTKRNNFYFLGTINNTFRVLALNYNSTQKEITKRVSDLLIYAGMGKSPKFDTDLFFGEVDRTVENIKDVAKILDNPDKKLYHSLLYYIEENEADRDFLKDLHKLNNIANCIDFKYFIINNINGSIAKLNYSESINYFSEAIFENTKSRLNDFIGSKCIYEELKFELYDDITSKFPSNENCQRISNQFIVTSNTENGVLLIENLYFDKETDYEIEFDCKWLEGVEDNKLFSIVFCRDVDNNYYRFGISANGYFYFDAIIAGVEQNLSGWHKNEYLNIKGKNNLKISYSSDNNDFGIEINGEYPKEISEFGIDALKSSLKGNCIGVSVFGKQKIAFSNFKISYRHRISKWFSKSKIKSTNISSAINLVASNLCLCSFVEKQFYYHITETISLFGEILNSNCMPEFASKVVGIHTNIDISAIERYFVDDIYNFVRPQLDKDERVETKEFIETFHSFSDGGQNYVIHKFIGKPIFDIEDSITRTKQNLKNTPLEGVMLGFNLFNTTKENLPKVRKILSYTNYQYRLLANNLADTILDCCIIYFNALQKRRDVLLTDGNQILELINHANTIAIGGEVRKRVDENTDFFEKWISNTQNKDKEKFKLEQDKKHQEKERLKEEQERFRQEQERINSERLSHLKEKQRLEDESKRLAIKNQPLNKLKAKLRKAKRIFFTILIFIFDNFKLMLVGGIILYAIFAYVTSETSRWKGNSLENGAAPYDNIFGEGIFNYRSKSWLTFKNGNSTDAIACLVNYYSGTTIRNSYIRAGTNYTMSNLPEGIYKVKVFYGKDWNPEKPINNGSSKGGFENDASYSLSDNTSDLIQINITETSYTTGEITLYTVSNGNMNQRKINSNEFFK